jgi:hypothetical protein
MSIRLAGDRIDRVALTQHFSQPCSRMRRCENVPDSLANSVEAAELTRFGMKLHVVRVDRGFQDRRTALQCVT